MINLPKKILFIYIPTLILSVVVFGVVKIIVENGPTVGNITIGILLYGFWGIGAGLTVILEKTKHWIYSYGGLVALSSLIFFPPKAFLFLGMAILISAFVYAWWRVKREAASRRTVRSYWFFRKSLPPIFTAFAFLVAIPFTFQPVSVGDISFPRPLFDQLVGPAEKALDLEVSGKVISVDQEKVREGLYTVLDQNINNLSRRISENNPELTALAFGLAIFLTLRVLNIPLAWLATLGGMAAVWLLRKARYLRIEKEEAEIEKLIIDN